MGTSNQPDKVTRFPRPPFAQFLNAVLLFALGVWGGYWVISESYHGFASLRWRRAEGIVLRTWVEKSFSKGNPQWSPHVLYQYSVNGVPYENERISYPETRSSPQD